MSQHGGDAGRRLDRADARNRADRLLRAVQELRALDREKRETAPASKPFHDLTRRLENKAREVFRMAADEGDETAEAEVTGHRSRH